MTFPIGALTLELLSILCLKQSVSGLMGVNVWSIYYRVFNCVSVELLSMNDLLQTIDKKKTLQTNWTPTKSHREHRGHMK